MFSFLFPQSWLWIELPIYVLCPNSSCSMSATIRNIELQDSSYQQRFVVLQWQPATQDHFVAVKHFGKIASRNTVPLYWFVIPHFSIFRDFACPSQYAECVNLHLNRREIARYNRPGIKKKRDEKGKNTQGKRIVSRESFICG